MVQNSIQNKMDLNLNYQINKINKNKYKLK